MKKEIEALRKMACRMLVPQAKKTRCDYPTKVFFTWGKKADECLDTVSGRSYCFPGRVVAKNLKLARMAAGQHKVYVGIVGRGHGRITWQDGYGILNTDKEIVVSLVSKDEEGN